jgi:HlyD family secretion protein
MDRPLDADFTRRQKVRRVALGGSLLSVAVIAFAWGPSLIEQTVPRARLRTAAVSAGPIDATITASGTVVPEFEHVMASPLDARVVRILRIAGTAVKAGDPIVELDVSQSVLEVDKLAQNLALKVNAQTQTKLALEKNLADLNSRAEIRRLALEVLRTQVRRNRVLLKEGLISDDVLRQSELSEAQADIELKQIESEKRNANAATRAQLDGLALEMATLRKEAVEARRQLELARLRVDRDGVLTWVVTEAGSTVRKGEVVARVADLRSFRVDATVSDVHARRLRPGMPVAIRAGEETLRGAVSSVLPKIENGAITFVVALEEKSSPVLRSNLRVDVDVVTERRARAIRAPRAPYGSADGAQQAFVIRGERAFRTPMRLGVASFEHVEVLEGLQPGDEVIVSDMTDYMHLKSFRVR